MYWAVLQVSEKHAPPTSFYVTIPSPFNIFNFPDMACHRGGLTIYLFTIYYLLFTIHCSPLTIYNLLSPINIFHFSSMAYHRGGLTILLFTIYYSQFTTYYLLFTFYYLLITIYYLLYSLLPFTFL